VAAILASSQARSERRLRLYEDGATVRGIDELLSYLEQAIAAPTDRLASISSLVKRAGADFAVGCQLLFCGLPRALFNVMRGAMETEFLLRDFLMIPGNARRWQGLPDRARRRDFKPAVLRERFRRRHGENAQEERDYALHSSLLHVTPKDVFPLGFVDDDHPAALGMCFWEYFFHGGRVVELVERHRHGLTLDAPLVHPLDRTVPAFIDAHQRASLRFAMWWPNREDGG
jgi:hypothetical protein